MDFCLDTAAGLQYPLLGEYQWLWLLCNQGKPPENGQATAEQCTRATRLQQRSSEDAQGNWLRTGILTDPAFSETPSQLLSRALFLLCKGDALLPNFQSVACSWDNGMSLQRTTFSILICPSNLHCTFDSCPMHSKICL